MNVLSTTERAAIIRCLVEGNSIRSTCRMTGAAKGTVLKLLRDIGCVCAAFHDRAVRGLRPQRVQADEIWTFSGAKDKNIPKEKKGDPNYGSVWTWTAIDADTRFCISWLGGDRDGSCARAFVDDIAGRVTNKIQFTTDGLKLYIQAVEDSFGPMIDYAILNKVYGAERAGEARYSPAVCIGCKPQTICGTPDPDHVSTSFVERQNLTMRMGSRRFTRLTNAFTKKVENLAHAVALHFVYYNFARRHMTLKVTPAMAAGLADHVWSVEEIVGLLDSGDRN